VSPPQECLHCERESLPDAPGAPASGTETERVRVLHLIASRFVGGPQRQILMQAQLMDPARFEVTLATFLREDEGDALLAEAAAQGVTAVALEAGGPFDLRPVGELRGLLKERRIDVLCAHDSKSVFVGYRAARRCGIPIVGWARGWTGETLRVRIYDAIHRWLLRRVDAVVAVSQAMGEEMLRRGLSSARVTVIPNAFAGQAAPAADGRLRRELGIGADTPLVVSVGRLSREKGHRYLVEAAAALARDGHRFALVIVGDGREEAGLRKQVAERGLAGTVHLVGFRTDIPAIMAEADVVALPSLTEGLPNVVLEAFAAGKPVVATRVGGVPEAVEDGRTGLLVPARDPTALAAGIAACLDDPARAARIGEEARRALEDYSPEVQVRRVEELLERIAGGAAVR
jgi:glycosyltransferase involved in cell wall biosynthesis